MQIALRYALVPAAGMLLGAALVLVAGRVSPVMAAVVLAGMLATLALVRFPYLTFMLTVAVIPMERLGRLTDDSSAYTISLMRLLGTLALGSMLLYAVSHRWRLRFSPALIVYIAYWILALVTIGHSTDFIGSVRQCGAILSNIMFFFLVTNMVRDWKTAKLAIIIWLGATVFIGLYTTYNWHFGAVVADAGIGSTDTRFSVVHDDTSEYQALDTVKRALGPTSHSAVYAINNLLTVPFFLYFLRTRLTRPLQVLVAGSLALVLYNVLLANTRAAILLTGLVMAMAVVRGLIVLRPGTVAMGVIGVAALLPLVPASTWERVLDISNYSLQKSGTLQVRLEYWKSALGIIRDNWAFGVGVGNQLEVPKGLNSIHSSARSATAHCEYLQTFLELGIAGWLLFLTFLYLTLRYAFKAAAVFRRLNGCEEQYWFMIAVQTTMIATLLYGLQVDVFHFPLKGWWLVAGISVAMYAIAREYRQNPPAQRTPPV